MPFRDAAVQSPWGPDEPPASDTMHHILFGPVRSGKSVFSADAVLPEPSEAATRLPPSEAAPTGDVT